MNVKNCNNYFKLVKEFSSLLCFYLNEYEQRKYILLDYKIK